MKMHALSVACLTALYLAMSTPAEATTITIRKTFTITTRSASQTTKSVQPVSVPTPVSAPPTTTYAASASAPSPLLVAQVSRVLTDEQREIARQIRKKFGPDGTTMIAIALAESGLRKDVWVVDSNGYQAVGILQINDGRWFSAQDIVNLQNVDHNLERAHQKYLSQGYRAWGAWHNGSYLKFINFAATL